MTTKKVRQRKHNLKSPFIDHLHELRSRLLVVMVGVLGGFIIGYLLRDKILYLLLKPLNQPLFYLSPAGGLDFVFKVCLFFGFILATPLIFFEVYKFLEPAFPSLTTKKTFLFVIVSFLLLILGVGFAYFLSLPASLKFLNTFGGDNIKSLISTDAYISFVMRYLLGFGILFQLPLILFVINLAIKLDIKRLFSFERWVILISFVASAIITPTPDAFNMSLMAVVPIILFQLSIILIVIYNKRRNRY